MALNIPEMIDLRDEMEEEIEFEKISALQTKTTAIFHRLLSGKPIHQIESEAENED